MSYDAKIVAASVLIQRHNNSISDRSMKIDIDQFVNCLKSSGGTSDEALSACTWEDLERCKLPRILARQVANIFRAKANEEPSGTIGYISRKKAEAMSVNELVSAYDPKEPDNVVGEILKKKSNGKRFLVFIDGKIDVKSSCDEINALRDNFPERKHVKVNGKLYETFAVGDSPDCYVEVNAMYPDQPLRNGECAVTGTPMNADGFEISIRARQLIYIARVETRELTPLNFRDARSIWNTAMGTGGFDRMSEDYPEAALRFRDLESLNQLPSLKMKLGRNSSSKVPGKIQDPFLGSNRVV